MPPKPAPSFGRRGTAAASANSGARPSRYYPPNTPSVLPPELVATILRRPGEDIAVERPKVTKVTKVTWSFRGAVLAGLVVGILNAAFNATSLLSFGSYDGLLGEIPLGQAKVPILVLVAGAGLWSGARASALALLFAHNVLNRLGRTSYSAYALAGGAASLVYAVIVETLGLGAHHSLILDMLSGAAAGFFYRLFTATERT